MPERGKGLPRQFLFLLLSFFHYIFTVLLICRFSETTNQLYQYYFFEFLRVQKKTTEPIPIVAPNKVLIVDIKVKSL